MFTDRIGRRAFTLTELLVVVAIVALLAGILVPVVSGVRKSAVTNKCLNNMRNLAIAHVLYQTEYDGRFIDVGLAHGGSHGNEDIAWVNTLEELYGSDLVLKSPADKSPHWKADEGGRGVPIDGTTDQFRLTSYGVNNFLVASASADPTIRYDRRFTVKAPTQTVHFLIMAEEGDFAGADHPHVENWFVPGNPNAIPAVAALQVATGMHGGKEASWEAVSNYSFLDGHVETAKFDEVYISHDFNRFDPKQAQTWVARHSKYQ